MTNDTQSQESSNLTAARTYEVGAEEALIIEGSVIESRVVDDTTAQAAQAMPGERWPSLLRLAFGSAVILTDEVGERIVVPEELLASRTPESVLRPVEEWDAILNNTRPFAQARYMTVGALGDARKVADSGMRLMYDVTDTAGRAFAKAARPLWNSFLFAPVRGPVRRMREAGEEKVQEWIIQGRMEEARSRALAQASLTNLVQESVTDLTESPQIQVLVQDVIQSQSTSIFIQILEEVRERFISVDMVLAGTLGKTRAPRPAFRSTYLESLRSRRPQFEHMNLENTLAGTYAGYFSRLAAFFIDVTILLIALALTSTFITSTLSLFGLTEPVTSFLSSGTLLANIAVVLLSLANVIAISGYGILFWNLTGSTPGHLIMGLRVINGDGQRLTFWQSLRRMIGAYVAGVVALLGFIWPLFDKRRQGWHDKIGGTFVIYDWPGKPEENFLRERVLEELQEDAQEAV